MKLFLLHILLLFSQLATGLNTLYPGQFLSIGHTLTSTNGIFQLGFAEIIYPDNFPRYYYDHGNYYYYFYRICIWYKKLPSQTRVWCTLAASGLSPRLEITIHGDLQVHGDEETVLICSSSHFNSTKLVLEKTGNLVFTSEPNTRKILWQSFDHPTDTWLPGAKLRFNKITKVNHVYNSISGVYSFELDTKETNAISLKKDKKRYGICRVKGLYFTCSLDLGWYTGEAELLVFNETKLSYVSTENEVHFSYTVSNSSILTRFVISYNGLLVQLMWSEDSQEWIPSKLRLSDSYCDQFAVYSNKRDYLRSSKCSTSTKTASSPKLQQESISEKAGQSMLQCHEGEKEGFLLIQNASLTLYDAQTLQHANTEECKAACLKNCNCTAYSDQNECQMWQENAAQIRYYPGMNLNLHIKLATTKTRKPGSKNNLKILGVGFCGISICIALGYLVWKCKSQKALHALKVESALKVYKYSDLQSATKNFTCKLGEGGFGFVYKGTLPNSTHSIAVKKLKVHSQGEKQFRAEICTLGIIHHVNLVLLQGFCVHGKKKLLVYDYLPNGSLDKHLFGCNYGKLDWSTRYKIALGVAKGLAYLHHECREQIIHCDIKPENILLDAEFNPKLADFGLAKLLGRDFSRVLTTMRGTRGYLAPEWIYGTEITAKADVYSYGMMLFEIISGRRNWSLRIEGEGDEYTPHQVMHSLTSNRDITVLLDTTLEGNAMTEELIRICKVAGWCVQDDEKDRPSMTHIVQVLEGISEVITPPLPRFLQCLADVPEEPQTIVSFKSSIGPT